MDKRNEYVEMIADDILNKFDDLDAQYSGDLLKLLKSGEIDEVHGRLSEDLFDDDDITGNGSGSYFMSRVRAESFIYDAWELVGDLLDEGYLSANILQQGPEAVDVGIRCALLPDGIDLALKKKTEELERIR